MTNKEFVLATMVDVGKAKAQAVQATADTMTATELIAQEDYIPSFAAAVATANMLTRPIGFVVKTGLGNVCKLLQVYDSGIYTAEPENLPSQWGFQWSQDPAYAKDFVAIATSPYMIGDCCIDDGVYRCLVDYTVNSPTDLPSAWEVASE